MYISYMSVCIYIYMYMYMYMYVCMYVYIYIYRIFIMKKISSYSIRSLFTIQKYKLLQNDILQSISDNYRGKLMNKN